MSSREDIAALHARGWTDSAIGRAVGRDSSLIHQIAVGKKPGNNLAPALDALKAGGAPGPKTARQAPAVAGPLPEAPRRVRASGQPARVRHSAKEPAAREGRPASAPREHLAGARELPNGQRTISGSSKASAKFAAGMASDTGHARIRIAYKDAQGKWHSPGRKGGLTPEQLREFLKGRTWREALAAIAAYFYGPGAASEPTGEAEFYIVGAS